MPDVSEEKHLSQGHPWDVYSILRVTSVLARMVWAELFCIRWPLLEILGSSHRKEGRNLPQQNRGSSRARNWKGSLVSANPLGAGSVTGLVY